jgi:hypothetical protein
MMLNSHFDVGFVSSSPLDASVIGQMVPSIEERSFLTVQCNMRFTFTFLPVCAPLQFACREGCGAARTLLAKSTEKMILLVDMVKDV